LRPSAKLVIGFILFIASSGVCLAGSSVNVSSSIDKKSVNIGEKIRYTIVASGAGDISIEFPDLTKAFKDFAVVDSGQKTSSFFGRKTITLRATLQTFTPGAYTILKQAVKYKTPRDKDWQTALSQEHAIAVKSLVNEKTRFADIKGPISSGAAIPVIILLILAVLAPVLVFWKRIFRKKQKIAVEMQPWKAHEIAYAQLEELRRKELLAKGMVKPYYSEISNILRHYLENRFSLKAPEMTTEEFFVYVRDYSELGRERKDLLKDFLVNCDLVKFAKHIPPDAEGEAAFDTTKKFVDQTKMAEPQNDAQLRKK
jgi:hypothetical protein